MRAAQGVREPCLGPCAPGRVLCALYGALDSRLMFESRASTLYPQRETLSSAP